MILETIQVLNYKSIKDSLELKLDPKLNVICGKNNMGKTALIEALYNCFRGNLELHRHQQFEYKIFLSIKLNNIEEQSPILAETRGLYRQNRDRIFLSLNVGHGITFLESFLFIDSENDEKRMIYEWDFSNQRYNVARTLSNTINSIPKALHNIFRYMKDHIIFLTASRYPSSSRSNIFFVNELDITASNLHLAFHTLHSNKREVFDKIEDTFKKIFPDVTNIRSLINSSDNATTINFDFEGLTEIPLDQSGSGYTQVLIFLYVLYAESNRIILFDEPQTHLHPFAEKALYDLTAKDNNHSFIFTTHSPILINYPVSKQLYLATKVNGCSNFTSLVDTQHALRDIGVTNSDFALADRMIFVEGPTEISVLPLILGTGGMEQFGYNYTLAPLHGTGDEYHRTKKMGLNARVYEATFNHLSSTPIPYRILLDRDERNEDEVAQLQQIFHNNASILTRREIENYFLIPSAIKAVLEISHSDNTFQIDIDEIDAYINYCLTQHDNHNYFPKKDLIKDQPKNVIKASSVLSEIFEKYGIIYNKPKHGKQIVEWLISHGQIEGFEEITCLFRPWFNEQQ